MAIKHRRLLSDNQVGFEICRSPVMSSHLTHPPASEDGKKIYIMLLIIVTQISMDVSLQLSNAAQSL